MIDIFSRIEFFMISMLSLYSFERVPVKAQLVNGKIVKVKVVKRRAYYFLWGRSVVVPHVMSTSCCMK